jgi:photosynthetic reaction center cytochrome c subunit
MKTAFIHMLSAFIVVICVLGIQVPTARAQHAVAPGTAATTAEAGKTAEQVFKNIQVLKGTPADQLQPAMQFISNSLGVECEFCHVQGAFEKDDKKAKLTARQMIEMQMAINKANFKDRTEVTCFSCHRGAHDPVGVPIIADEEPKRPEVQGILAAPASGAAEKIIEPLH